MPFANSILDEVREALEGHNIAVTPGPRWDDAVRLLARARYFGLQAAQAQAAGHLQWRPHDPVASTPSAPLPASVSSSSTSVSAVVAGFLWGVLGWWSAGVVAPLASHILWTGLMLALPPKAAGPVESA